MEIWYDNPTERPNRDIRRRAGAVGFFPNRNSIIRRVGAPTAEPEEFP